MQALGETIFDLLYLVGVLIAGISMLRNSEKGTTRWLFGLMAVVLGSGDAFHLVPRSYALWTIGLEANAAALGFGKLVTSVTMTLFYLLLYGVWRRYFRITEEKTVTRTLLGLALLRIVLCALPQNQWLSQNPPLLYGILRNLPFAAIGGLLIYLFHRENKKRATSHFKGMPLAITLSFLFYIPVVLFAHLFPLVGVLMIPKTMAYVWIVWMGWKLPKTLDLEQQLA